MNSKLITDGEGESVYYPDIEIVEYSSSKNTRVIFGLEYSRQP